MMLKSISIKKTNETVKQELLNLLKENDNVDKLGLNEAANETSDPQKTILLIRRYQEIIKTQN